MQRVDFYKLPRTLQERFLGSVHRRAPPVPILVGLLELRAPQAWIGVSGGALLVLLVFVRIGLGALGSALAIHGPPLIAVYALLIATSTFAMLRAFAVRRAIKKSPYRPGV